VAPQAASGGSERLEADLRCFALSDATRLSVDAQQRYEFAVDKYENQCENTCGLFALAADCVPQKLAVLCEHAL
jgi:hypothetical protein